MDFKPTRLQWKLWQTFHDSETKEVLFGGAAGSAKSFGLCSLGVIKCLELPGIRFSLCRKNFTVLKRTTLVSLFEVLTYFGLKPDFDYFYKQQEAKIQFNNGSEIIFVDLDYYPSDPDYQKLGGLLVTCNLIDEVGELNDIKAYTTIISRAGRWKNEELNVMPMTISTCNPTTNFIKQRFYTPSLINELPPYRKFIKGTLKDNPYLSDEYRLNLEQSLDEIQKKRLLYGLWEYEESDFDLFRTADIEQLFALRDFENSKTIATIDLAVDRDDTVALIWNGLTVVDIVKAKPEVNNIQFIKQIRDEYNINLNNIVYDASGLGADIKKHYPAARAFIGASKVIGKEKYKNLRHQCFFKLSEYTQKGLIYIATDKEKQRIKRELKEIKRLQHILNNVEIIPKKDIKRVLGHSPDLADCLSMRMLIELKQGRTGFA